MSGQKKRADLAGQRFGRLVVLGPAGRDRHGNAKWLCRCDCGNESTPTTLAIRHGAQSCGCLFQERSREAATKHGGKGTRLYGIWKGMRKRCLNPNGQDFRRYGGAGVTVCEEWSSFAAFREWALGNGYTEALSIDRIDTSGGYGPDNCRWADLFTQSANRRTFICSKSGFTGVRFHNGKWEAMVQFNGERIYCGAFDDPLEAAAVRDAWVVAKKWPHVLNLGHEVWNEISKTF
jgi:hypothetical protein